MDWAWIVNERGEIWYHDSRRWVRSGKAPKGGDVGDSRSDRVPKATFAAPAMLPLDFIEVGNAPFGNPSPSPAAAGFNRAPTPAP